MYRLSHAIAVASLLMAAGCAKHPVTSLQKGAEHIVVSSEGAGPRAELLGTVEGVDGDGCRGFGRLGVDALAEMDLRNKAAAMGGDFVQVTSTRLPGVVDGACRTNTYVITGSVYRIPGTLTLEQRLARGGPLVLPPQEGVRDEPNFQPAAIKPRELRKPADRERVFEHEDDWKERELSRYVSVYSDEGRSIIAGEPRKPAPVTEQITPDMPAGRVTSPPPAPRPLNLPASSKGLKVIVTPRPLSETAAVAPAPAPVAEPTPAVIAAPAPAPVPAVAPVAAFEPAPASAPAVVAAPVMPAPVVRASAAEPVVLPPPPSPVTTVAVAPAAMPVIEPQPMPVPQSLQSSASMPVPAPGVRQVTLSPDRPAGAVAAAPAALTREERDRQLEELARDTSLSYQEYQRRYREIMGN